MASIFDLFDNDNAQDAANAQIAAINSGATQATNTLNNGLSQAQQSYTAALQPINTNLATTQAGQTAYADALGLNGTAASQQALQNWQTTNPAYQAQLDAASANVARNQAATGQLASGATDVDLQTLAENQANSTYQQYLANLQPFVNASTANAGQAAAVDTSQAGTQANTANQLASLQYGAATSQGNAQANADLANNSAAANQLGALQSGAGLASSLLGFL